jgi:hypothetical protein
MITNSTAQTVNVQRIVTGPDVIFSALDEVSTLGTYPPVVNIEQSSINFDQANILAGLAGPGTIIPTSTISFEKVGPIFYNQTGAMDGTPFFTDLPGDGNASSYYQFYTVWGSFDGTTNDPVVYPNGTSIADLESEVLAQITPPTLTIPLTENVYYPDIATFTVSGGGFTAPYTWTATGLPSGLSLTTGGVLQGTPTQAGVFDFTLILTDSLGRSAQWGYTITINQ